MVDRDITKDNLVLNFLDVFNKLEKIPTTSDMNKNGIYSVSTYEKHFKSWNNFLVTQDIKPTKRHVISKGEMVNEFKKLKSKLKKVPTKAEFDTHSDFSSSSFTRLWGSWTNFLKEQGIKTLDVSDSELKDEYFKLKVYLGKSRLTQADMNRKGRFFQVLMSVDSEVGTSF